MCIIAIKPIGEKLPTKEILEQMFYSNPDGAGIMYNDNNKVIIKKGFMSMKEYLNAISEIKNPTEKTVIIHTRITTHGQSNRENCHPFILSNKLEDLRRINVATDIGIAHNGIIKIDMPKNAKHSDTMEYIKTTLYKHYKQDKYYHRKEENRNTIKSEITSKMVFLEGNGDYYVVGEFNESNNILYSNYSWIPYKESRMIFNEFRTSDIDLDEDTYLRLLEDEISNNREGRYGNYLEYDDYILMDGQKIFGDEIEMYVCNDGVYGFVDDSYIPIKVSDVAYSGDGTIIKFVVNEETLEIC